MLVLNFNVDDTNVEVLPQDRTQDDYVTSLSLCNEFSGSLSISIYKMLGATKTYIINSVSIAEKESFVLQAFTVEKTHSLVVESINGPSSVVLEYFHA